MKDDDFKLGDRVERIIHRVAPKLAEKAEQNDCGCKKRKQWLNNIGAKFS